MLGIGFVSEESYKKGRELEERLTHATKEMGILFASVLPNPVQGGQCKYFTVVVGVSRDRSMEMTIPAVEMLFAKEMKDGSFFSIEVVRGTVGAAAYKAVPGPTTSSS